MVLSEAYEIKAEGQRFGMCGDEPEWLRLRHKQKQHMPPLPAEIDRQMVHRGLEATGQREARALPEAWR